MSHVGAVACVWNRWGLGSCVNCLRHRCGCHEGPICAPVTLWAVQPLFVTCDVIMVYLPPVETGDHGRSCPLTVRCSLGHYDTNCDTC